MNMIDKKTLTEKSSAVVGALRARGQVPQIIHVDDINNRSALPAPETRSIGLRRRLTVAYLPQFSAFASSLVTEEVTAVREALQKFLGKRSQADLSAWLENYYKELAVDISKKAKPLVSGYGLALTPIAQEEIASNATIGPQFEQFTNQYLNYLAERHVSSSKAQIIDVLKTANDAGTDPADAVNERLAEWEQKRPDKFTQHESYRAENAMTRAVFLFSGVSKLRWVAFGKNCPYCSSLNGKVVGIQQDFLQAGSYQPDGAKEPLIVKSSKKHAPAHAGCDCGIAAEH